MRLIAGGCVFLQNYVNKNKITGQQAHFQLFNSTIFFLKKEGLPPPGSSPCILFDWRHLAYGNDQVVLLYHLSFAQYDLFYCTRHG